MRIRLGALPDFGARKGEQVPYRKVSIPDTDELIRLNREEDLTLSAIAARFGVHHSVVSRRFKAAGVKPRKKEKEAPKPPPTKTVRSTPTRPSRRPGLSTSEKWSDILHDYSAGDSPIVLAKRYGELQQVIDRALHQAGVPMRDRKTAVDLVAQQRQAADEVRYQLRTGALERAASDLGVDAGTLHRVLDQHGILLHDYDSPR